MRTEIRTGILGGTFNPIHNGHVDIGLRVRARFNLDSVRYILSARPPHKNTADIVPADLRWRMLEAGLAPHPELIPDDIEIRRDEYSWTIDTVREMISLYPDDTFYFLSGSEGFLKIRTWKEYNVLFNLINFIVVMRTGEQEEAVTRLLRKEGITPSVYGQGERKKTAVHFYTYESEFLHLSSTKVRKIAAEGGKIDNLVNIKVKEIIEENNLYGKNQPG